MASLPYDLQNIVDEMRLVRGERLVDWASVKVENKGSIPPKCLQIYELDLHLNFRFEVDERTVALHPECLVEGTQQAMRNFNEKIFGKLRIMLRQLQDAILDGDDATAMQISLDMMEHMKNG